MVLKLFQILGSQFKIRIAGAPDASEFELGDLKDSIKRGVKDILLCVLLITLAEVQPIALNLDGKPREDPLLNYKGNKMPINRNMFSKV
ncbi:hypothetical protein NPIL_551181 [Nephila pilipes]|uniref:Uncharacterized protein n=1 Tax=Nephila pilipes TaxID=299642 RepID=A0A8X6NLC2_NEPPI|nr:hypothetical protein NPIL_551181 [Nephila pilipes]